MLTAIIPGWLCAQGLSFTFHDGTVANALLTDVRSLTLANNGLRANLWDGSSWSSIRGVEENELSTVVPTLSDGLEPLRAWPNPASGVLFTEVEMEMAGPVRIDLFDATGRLVWSDAHSWLAQGRQVLRLDQKDIGEGTLMGMHTLLVTAPTRTYALRIQWQ